MKIQEVGSVLGIDVGCSPKRRSSAVCRIDWSLTEINWIIDRFRAVDHERDETIATVSGSAELLCVAVDGPVRRGFDLVRKYRTAERMLTRKLQPLIGKPGQSSSPVGMMLNQHANACVLSALKVGRVGPATHTVRIDDAAVVEAFPSSFLGLLVDDPKGVPTSRARRSDTLFKHLADSGELERLITYLLPRRTIKADLRSVKNHDDRAGLICALVALAVARGDYTAVGDDDGWIILPPRSFIRNWGWSLLEQNAENPAHLHIECRSSRDTSVSFERFELRRMSDDLVYVFIRRRRADGQIGYQRADRDLWILHRPHLGWVAWDETTESVSGRPWSVLPADQADHPPEGEWVSKKGVKSYVYRLVYV